MPIKLLRQQGVSLPCSRLRRKAAALDRIQKVLDPSGTARFARLTQPGSAGRLRLLGLALTVTVAAACATVQVAEEAAGPPPPQNLIGSTDEFQLVAELSLDLARQYGGEKLLVVLQADHLLLGRAPESGPEVMLPAQPDVAQQIRRMQESGLKVIAISARDSARAPQVVAALDGGGIDLRGSAWPPQGGFPEPFVPAGADRPVSYRDGVYLTSGQGMGVMLNALLEESAAAKPILMVVADSNRANLNAVMKEFSWTSTKVHAWRYTRGEEAPSP